MTKRMIIDAAHAEETRVVVVDQKNLVEEFDFESKSKSLLRGNIYLAKIARIEPSLQAAFVDYGGNRHGFLAFNEIHPDYYQIPAEDRDALIEAEAAVNRAMAEKDAKTDSEMAARNIDAEDESDDLDVEEFNDDGQNEIEEVHSELSGYGSDDEDDEPTEQKDEQKLGQGPNENGPDAEPLIGQNVDTEDEQTDDSNPADIEANSVASSVALETKFDSSISSEVIDGQISDEDRADTPSSLEGELTDPVLDENKINALSNDVELGVVSDEVDDEDPMDELRRLRRQKLRGYKIQEVIKKRQIILVQVVKEERGNKGAALTTYLSLAGRYCVLMPNTGRGGGISRKIGNVSDRRRLRKVVDELDVPQGMGLIIRTAGSKRTKAEIKRDYEHLLRIWESVRQRTLESIAPSLVYEEGSLVKRAIRDLYSKDIEEVIVEGDEAYKDAKSFMRMLMPSHAKNVKQYKEPYSLFQAFQIETQLDATLQPTVQLRSGGYLVINPTEALVSIDVNSGRSTKERSVEHTALHTNLEAAEEVARQCRLRDLAGLIVIDFIDMEENRNNRAVEKRLKDSMRRDRARVQIGRISPFGLMEMSRQRMRSGVLEGSSQTCAVCSGTGNVRSNASTALRILRGLDEVCFQNPNADSVSIRVTSDVALFLLNEKKADLAFAEEKYAIQVRVEIINEMMPSEFEIEGGNTKLTHDKPSDLPARLAITKPVYEPSDEEEEQEETSESNNRNKKRRRRRGRKSGRDAEAAQRETETVQEDNAAEAQEPTAAESTGDDEKEGESNKGRRRRGRRGGRRRRRSNGENANVEAGNQDAVVDNDGAEQSAQGETTDQPIIAEAQSTAEQESFSEFHSANLEANHQIENTEQSSVETAPNTAEIINDQEVAQSELDSSSPAPQMSWGSLPENDDQSISQTDQSVEERHETEQGFVFSAPSEPELETPVLADNNTAAEQVESSDPISPSNDDTTAEQPDEAVKKRASRRGWWQKGIG